MATVSYQFAYSIGDRVVIDYGITGVVTGLMVESEIRQFRVAWWNNGDSKSEWFYEYRISGL